MKKFFSILLSLSLVFALAACNNGGEPASTTAAPATTKADTTTTTPVTSEEADSDHDHDHDHDHDDDHDHDHEHDHDHDHGHSHAPISDFIPEFDAVKEAFGVEEVQSSVIALSWVDNIYLINAGAPVAALPDNHHIPEEILAANKMFTDHDGNVDLELIKELKPAVIFANSRSIDGVEGLAELIEEIEAKVLQIPAASSYGDVLKNIGLLSALFGTEEIAAENIHVLMHRIIDAFSLIDEDSAKKVAVVTITADGEFVMRDNDFQNDLLALVNAENVAADIEFEGDADQSGSFASPGVAALKEAGADAFVIMVRIKGNKDAREAAIAKITEEITEAYGEDSIVVKNHRYDIIDHHGFIISFPGAISGLENLADIISR